MACNRPPPPPPFRRGNSVPPPPPPTPPREQKQPPKNFNEAKFEKEFSFPVLQEVFVQQSFFPEFKVTHVVDFDEERIGDLSLYDVSDDDDDEAYKGEKWNKRSKTCPNGKGTKPSV